MSQNQSINATWLPNWVEARAHFFQQINVGAAEVENRLGAGAQWIIPARQPACLPGLTESLRDQRARARER